MPRADVKVPVGHWKWTESKPFPPKASVLQSQFWKNKHYQGIWDNLKKAVPVFNVMAGGDFVSVNTRTSSVSVLSEAVLMASDEEEVCTVSMQPCDVLLIHFHCTSKVT